MFCIEDLNYIGLYRTITMENYVYRPLLLSSATQSINYIIKY